MLENFASLALSDDLPRLSRSNDDFGEVEHNKISKLEYTARCKILNAAHVHGPNQLGQADLTDRNS